MDNTYPDDFFLLLRQIKIRKIDEYLIQHAIISNPNKEPKDAQEFIDELLKQQRFMTGEDEIPGEIDRDAIANFKKRVQKQSKMVKTRVK